VRFAPGTDVAAARAALAKQLEVDGPSPPTSIQNVEQLSRLPIVLAVFFALIAVIALTNAVATALVRRRRDIAVLRAIGFTPRQSGRVLLSMVSTTALVGVVGGVPLGLVIGNRLWQAVAEGMNVAPSSVRPIAVVAVTAVGALVVANLVGALPAALAARRAAAADLRAE
jgi:ABC-type antimicrobial peptide transport system permease subunit